MTEAQALIRCCRELGVTLTPIPGGMLKVHPSKVLSAELKAALKHHKAEILPLLSEPCSPSLSVPQHRQSKGEATDDTTKEVFAMDGIPDPREAPAASCRIGNHWRRCPRCQRLSNVDLASGALGDGRYALSCECWSCSLYWVSVEAPGYCPVFLPRSDQ